MCRGSRLQQIKEQIVSFGLNLFQSLCTQLNLKLWGCSHFVDNHVIILTPILSAHPQMDDQALLVQEVDKLETINPNQTAAWQGGQDSVARWTSSCLVNEGIFKRYNSMDFR